MPNFSYTRGESTYAITPVVSDDEYDAAAEMFANALGVPVATVEYCFGYGLKQSLQDSAAQPASEAKQSGDDVSAAIKGAMDKRFAAIMAGTVAMRVGGGATRDPFESAVRQITASWLKAKAKSKGKPLPKDKAKLAIFTAKFYEVNKSAIDAEAKQRVEAAKQVEGLVYGEDFF